MEEYNRRHESKPNLYKHKKVPGLIKGGTKQTNNLSKQDLAIALNLSKNNIHLGEGNIVIRFKTDKEGERIAKSLSNLAANPAMKLNVRFEKITE